jgi:hypothetical protein
VEPLLEVVGWYAQRGVAGAEADGGDDAGGDLAVDRGAAEVEAFGDLVDEEELRALVCGGRGAGAHMQGFYVLVSAHVSVWRKSIRMSTDATAGAGATRRESRALRALWWGVTNGLEVPDVPAREPVPAARVAAALRFRRGPGRFVPRMRQHAGYLAAHHVIPRREGGADHPANLVALCASCHGQQRAA